MRKTYRTYVHEPSLVAVIVQQAETVTHNRRPDYTPADARDVAQWLNDREIMNAQPLRHIGGPLHGLPVDFKPVSPPQS